VQDFDYKFNSWGFRGNEYTDLIGKPVNICLGDSFTVNVGAPIEHSWCSQLAKHTELPCVNLGIDGAGNDAIKLIYNRACNVFDVQYTFVMYSFFHRKLYKGNLLQDASLDYSSFPQHRIQNAFECFLPFWAWSDNESQYIDQSGIFYLKSSNPVYSDIQHLDRKHHIDQKKYAELQGNTWPSYYEFINGSEPHKDMYTSFGNIVDEKMLHVNRDGLHMNQKANQAYVEYFLSKM